MKTYLNFRNNLTMLYKNLADDELKGVMRMRWFLDYLAAFQMLILERKFKDFKAVVKARRDFKKWKDDFIDDRSFIQASRSVETRIYRASAVSLSCGNIMPRESGSSLSYDPPFSLHNNILKPLYYERLRYYQLMG